MNLVQPMGTAYCLISSLEEQKTTHYLTVEYPAFNLKKVTLKKHQLQIVVIFVFIFVIYCRNNYPVSMITSSNSVLNVTCFQVSGFSLFSLQSFLSTWCIMLSTYFYARYLLTLDRLNNNVGLIYSSKRFQNLSDIRIFVYFLR